MKSTSRMVAMAMMAGASVAATSERGWEIPEFRGRYEPAAPSATNTLSQKKRRQRAKWSK